MIYSNKSFTARDVEMSFGMLKGFYLGEFGRGRQRVFIPSAADVVEGINEGLTVKLSMSGKPKIVEAYDPAIYIIACTGNGYTRRGCGRIEIFEGEGAKILAEGNGADGDAGGIGSWGDYVLQVTNKDFCIKVHYSGGSHSNPHGVNWFLFQEGDSLKFVSLKELADYLDTQDTTPAWALTDAEDFNQRIYFKS